MRISVRARTADDSGVTLVEVLVALTIASGVFLSLAFVSIAGVKGLLLARQTQLAGDMLNQAVEKVRALDFSDVALVTGDTTLASDPRIVSGTFDPGTGAEPVVYVGTGTLSPHAMTETHNNTTYQLYEYITQPAGLPGTRRLTVVVTWTSQGNTHSRQESTMVTATRRGLPLPRFLLAFSSPSALSRGAYTYATYGMRLKNYGARDSWNIAGPSGTWSYVVDTNKDGVLQSTETTALADTNGDGIIDTGPIETNAELFILATTKTSDDVGTGQTFTWKFTSVAQPLASSASQQLTGTLNVSGTPSPTPTPTPTSTASGSPQTPWPLPAPSCATSCTLPVGTLHEPTLGDHLTSGIPSTWDLNGLVQTGQHNYSMEMPGSVGRYLGRGGVLATDTNKLVVADWRQQATSKITVQPGQAVLYLYVSCLTGPTSETVNVGIGTSSANAPSYGSYTQQATGTATLTTCDGTFRQLAVPVTISSSFSVTKNNWLVVRAVLPSTAVSDVRLGYDDSMFASTVVIPQ